MAPRGNQSQGTSAQQGGNAATPSETAITIVYDSDGQPRYKVPPLDDNAKDYMLWSRVMKLILQQQGLWEIVSGTSVAPDPAADATAYNAWNDRDQKALLQIILPLNEAAQNCVLYAETSKVCWDTLASRYQAKDMLEKHARRWRKR